MTVLNRVRHAGQEVMVACSFVGVLPFIGSAAAEAATMDGSIDGARRIALELITGGLGQLASNMFFGVKLSFNSTDPYDGPLGFAASEDFNISSTKDSVQRDVEASTDD